MPTAAASHRRFHGALTASVAMLIACGGGDDGANPDGGAGATGGTTGAGGTGGTTMVTVPDVCQRQADCPGGYFCVPPQSAFTTALDQECFDNCSATCDFAGPFMAMCRQDCTTNCTMQVPPPDGMLMGKCFLDQGAPPSGGSGGVSGTPPGGGNSGGSGGGTMAPAMQWANTWTVEVEYTADCKWASTSMQMGAQKHTVTMKVMGSNATPSATLSGGYELEGTGGDDRMTLTGDFPFRNWKGETATTHSLNSPNEATIKMTTVESATKAIGTIEGNWDASGGWKCTAKNGKITMSR